jgi:hypothetical protein
MLLLRHGGQFTNRRIERHLWAGFMYVAAGVLVFIVIGFLSSPTFGLIAGCVIALRSKASFKYAGNWSCGEKGELAVTDALTSLPNDYVVLNDLMLPDGRGNIDHLVIGPNGLFVIETKNYSGYVKCWGDTWYVNNQKIRSLSKQAKRNAVAIKSSLDAVFAEHRSRVPFVTALLVFVDGNARFNIKEPTVPVIRGSELARYIADYRPARPRSPGSRELTRAIVHHLQLLQQKPDRLVPTA